jgi:3-phenylpropionate/cinnamic acid dioxygenase small subunit
VTSIEATTAPGTRPANALFLRIEVEEFYARYTRAIDRRDTAGWVALFASGASYSATSYENFTTTGMRWHTSTGTEELKDRVAICNGYFRAPLTKELHVVSNILVTENADGTVASEAYFVMYMVDRDGIAQMHVCGEYHDVLIRTDSGLLFKQHLAVVDSETLPANMGVLL